MAAIAYSQVSDLTVGHPEHDINVIENKVRAHVYATRVRMIDSFHGFDRLRRGFVTASQFRRCLGQCIEDSHNISYVTEDEYQRLINYYDTHHDGMVNYLAFIDSIDKVYGLRDLEKKPRQMVPIPREVLLNTRVLLSPHDESKVKEVLETVRQYVRHHGSDVKSWYRDFDKHNSGYVTYNQFLRGFPPNVLSPEDTDLIMSQYSDKATQTVNYYRMNIHVNRKSRAHIPTPDQSSQLQAKPNREEDAHFPVGTENLLGSTCLKEDEHIYPCTNNIEKKIKREVFKRRMHLLDFFRDYDRHGNGLITNHQFQAGIKQSGLPLTHIEIDTLCNAYRGPDDRVYYSKFCTSIDTIFTINGLEQDPTMQVYPPSSHFLYQPLNELSDEEEQRYAQIMGYIKHEVETRRIVLLPFFKDCSTGYITFSHFSRILSMLNLKLADGDLHLLFKKYLDHQRGLISYQIFLKTISASEFAKNAELKELSDPDEHYASEPLRFPKTIDMPALLNKLQYLIVTRRTRVGEFFRDYDKLRLGSIKRAEFIRGLNQMGCALEERDYNALARRYIDPEKPDCCKWKIFEQEMNQVFGPSHLEDQPRAAPVTQIIRNTSESVVANPLMSPVEEVELADLINTLREFTSIRQCRVKECFEEYDRLLSMTYSVTPLQLKQCLVKLKMQLTDRQIALLQKKWSDEKGDFHYESFAEAVEPSEISEPKPLVAQHALTAGSRPPVATYVDIRKLLARLKTKVKTERIRVIDAMRDFDPLRHGRITKSDFRRSCKTNSLPLLEAELAALENYFGSPDYPTSVNYVAFSDELESAFTEKGLESNPTHEPAVFRSFYEYEENAPVLTQEQNRKFEIVMHRLAETMRQHRMHLLTYFEDFDRIHDGTITPNQFRSVLGSAGLVIADDEFQLICMKFARQSDHMDYIQFWNLLSQFGKQQWHGEAETVP